MNSTFLVRECVKGYYINEGTVIGMNSYCYDIIEYKSRYKQTLLNHCMNCSFKTR